MFDMLAGSLLCSRNASASSVDCCGKATKEGNAVQPARHLPCEVFEILLHSGSPIQATLVRNSLQVAAVQRKKFANTLVLQTLFLEVWPSLFIV